MQSQPNLGGSRVGKIVGRKKEQEILRKLWRSKSAELVAIYGRRRIGKTFLVRELFSTEKRYFELAGKKRQL